METVSKLCHDHLQSRPQKKMIPYYLNQLPLVELLRFMVVFFLSAVEGYYILNKNRPIFSIIIPLSFLLLLYLINYCFSRSAQTYLVDFSCYKPPNFCRVPSSCFLEHMSMFGTFDNESIDFMAKVLASSGQGQRTYLPPSLFFIPPRSFHRESIEEVHMVLFPVMEDLLLKAKLSPRDLDILIVNCSGLCPSPSLASIVINRFKMRDDVKSFNVSGMGCSGSMLAVDMAQNLLRVHKDSNAVVLSTEILTTGWYSGNERNKLILNCLFRMGGAAILLSNRMQARRTSKYKLVRTLRTQRAFDDKAYRSAMRDEDSKGFTGVTLNRDIPSIVCEIARASITSLGSSILPSSEKLKFGLSILKKMLMKGSSEIYLPDFKRVIDHFCLPNSGRELIKGIAKGLKLNEKDVEAALATLHRFGNQSSSSLWYELAYLEAKQRVKKGDKVWQLGIGTGLKSTSVVWECIRPILGESKTGPWADSIDQYPTSLALD